MRCILEKKLIQFNFVEISEIVDDKIVTHEIEFDEVILKKFLKRIFSKIDVWPIKKSCEMTF